MRDVDVALLHVELEVRRVGVVPRVDHVGLRRAEETLVRGVRLVGDELVDRVARDVVLTRERVPFDDLVIGGERVGREDVLVDDRAHRARQDLGEDLVVRALQVEDDREVVGRVDRVEVEQQRRRAVRVGDLELTVERELHVGRGQIVAVRELQASLSLTV